MGANRSKSTSILSSAPVGIRGLQGVSPSLSWNLIELEAGKTGVLVCLDTVKSVVYLRELEVDKTGMPVCRNTVKGVVQFLSGIYLKSSGDELVI